MSEKDLTAKTSFVESETKDLFDFFLVKSLSVNR